MLTQLYESVWPTEIKSWTISLWRPSPEELYWYRTKPCSACHCNLLDAQIPQCIEKYPTMHHFVTEMCTFAHVCYKMVHCGLWDWCTVEFLRHEITYPLPIFNSTVEIWKWISNFIPPFIVETVTYNTCVEVKGTSLANVCLEKFCWRLAEQSRDKATVGSNRRVFFLNEIEYAENICKICNTIRPRKYAHGVCCVLFWTKRHVIYPYTSDNQNYSSHYSSGILLQTMVSNWSTFTLPAFQYDVQTSPLGVHHAIYNKKIFCL